MSTINMDDNILIVASHNLMMLDKKLDRAEHNINYDQGEYNGIIHYSVDYYHDFTDDYYVDYHEDYYLFFYSLTIFSFKSTNFYFTLINFQLINDFFLYFLLSFYLALITNYLIICFHPMYQFLLKQMIFFLISIVIPFDYNNDYYVLFFGFLIIFIVFRSIFYYYDDDNVNIIVIVFFVIVIVIIVIVIIIIVIIIVIIYLHYYELFFLNH